MGMRVVRRENRASIENNGAGMAENIGRDSWRVQIGKLVIHGCRKFARHGGLSRFPMTHR